MDKTLETRNIISIGCGILSVDSISRINSKAYAYKCAKNPGHELLTEWDYVEFFTKSGEKILIRNYIDDGAKIPDQKDVSAIIISSWEGEYFWSESGKIKIVSLCYTSGGLRNYYLTFDTFTHEEEESDENGAKVVKIEIPFECLPVLSNITTNEEKEKAFKEYFCDLLSISREHKQTTSNTTESQTFTSQSTSINSYKAPLVYRMPKAIEYLTGKTVIDIGGGKYDTAIKAAEEYGATVRVYDPYNRTPSHNKYVLSQEYQVAVISNVLNVINTKDARQDVIRLAAQKADTILITVYEGNRTGIGKQTKKDAWQENRKTGSYIREINGALPKGWFTTRYGKLIVVEKECV